MTHELPEYTIHQIAEHNTENDLWISIHGYVYDLTLFLEKHPGGKKPLLGMAGKEATEYFMKIKAHHSNSNIPRIMVDYCIGRLKQLR